MGHWSIGGKANHRTAALMFGRNWWKLVLWWLTEQNAPVRALLSDLRSNASVTRKTFKGLPEGGFMKGVRKWLRCRALKVLYVRWRFCRVEKKISKVRSKGQSQLISLFMTKTSWEVPEEEIASDRSWWPWWVGSWYFSFKVNLKVRRFTSWR